MGCRKCGRRCQGQYCSTHRHEQSPGLAACEGCLAPIHPDAVECPHCGIEQTERQLATDGGSTTYKYVSLVRCKGGNSAWDDEDGDESVVMGKVPKTWMPRLVVETEDGKDVIGVCYKRQAIAELPEWMMADEAFEWARKEVPDGFEEFYEGMEIATDGGVVEMPDRDDCQQCGGVFVLDRDSLSQECVRFECATPSCDEVHVVDRETARRRIGAETMETLQ